MSGTEGRLLPWHHKNWQLLSSYIQQKRIPQALLFIGAKGLGKYQLVQQFAFSLLCSKPMENGLSCGKCNSCLLIQAETHPDLIFIKPDEDKTAISINQIRQLIANAYLKPQFDSYRVAIVNPAEAMTPSAANAFLKCLEEPNERTIFALITDKPSKLPVTIISRCQKIKSTFPHREMVFNWLQGQGIDNNQETLISLLKDSILTTGQVTDTVLLKQRLDCFSEWLAIARNHGHPAMISEKWQKLPETDLLNWLISWVADLIKCTITGNQKQLCNQDLSTPLYEMAQRLNLQKLYKFYDLLIASRQRLGMQINIQMMFEEILVQWQELNGSS